MAQTVLVHKLDVSTSKFNDDRLAHTSDATRSTSAVGDWAMLDHKLALVYHDKDIRYLAGLQPPKKIHRELVEGMDESEFYRHPLMNEDGEDGY